MIKLYAPESYTAIERKKCNGCGSGWSAGLIPDSLLGCDITEACNIHDYMYTIGTTIEAKKEADRVFLNNMTRIILGRGGLLTRWRLWLARRYYNAVKYYGGAAFWEGKNKETEIIIIGRKTK